MKIIYGNNGVGKTLYKKNKQDDGVITLTSDISDWISNPIDNDDKVFEISQNARLISKSIYDFNELIDSIPNPDKIDKTTFKTFLSNNSFSGKKLNSIEFWNMNNFKLKGDVIDIHVLHKFMKEWNTLDWKNVTSEIKTKLYSIARINEKIVKSKRVLIKNENIENESLEQKFNLLLKSYNALMDQLLQTYPNKKELFSNLTTKILDAVFSEFVNFTEDEIFVRSLISYLSKIDNKDIMVNLAKSIINLKENRQNILIPKEKIFDSVNMIQIDEHTIKIESSKPLSSGQRTLLVLNIVIESSEDDIILDDVLETLDLKNKNIVMKWAYDCKSKITILTHDSYIEEVALNMSSSLSVNKPELLKIENQNEPIPHVGTSWINIIPKIWDKNNKRSNFELLLCKVFMRYNAKIGIVQNLKGIQNLKKLKTKSDVWLHWEESSLYFFHYFPKISFETLNAFFPFLSLKEDINTLDLVKKIVTLNNSFNKKDEEVLSIKKIDILLDELKNELYSEKEVYDKYTIDCENHKNWRKKPGSVYNDIARSKGITFNRQRGLIHTLDYSPVEITK